MWKIAVGLFVLYYPSSFEDSKNLSEMYPLKHAPRDTRNLASLQRGVKYFINFCSGCHSLHFIRYNQLAVDLGIIDGLAANSQRLKNNLIFTQAEPSDTIKPNLCKSDALVWFGKYPPDLSLSTRVRGVDWVYNYLLGFYQDDTRPFGVNNHVLKNTVMPDPFVMMLPANALTADHIRKNIGPMVVPLTKNRPLRVPSLVPESQHMFALEEVSADLVNFLSYAAEPSKTLQKSLGIKVCSFLFIFLGFVYYLKKQIWKKRPSFPIR